MNKHIILSIWRVSSTHIGTISQYNRGGYLIYLVWVCLVVCFGLCAMGDYRLIRYIWSAYEGLTSAGSQHFVLDNMEGVFISIDTLWFSLLFEFISSVDDDCYLLGCIHCLRWERYVFRVLNKQFGGT
jgi:hypothetical protein